MGIYYTQGIKNSRLRCYENNVNKPLPVEPFDFIKEFSAVETNGIDLQEFKEEHAPYCISGKFKEDKKGTYRRNDNSLIYRDLIFLDYDSITLSSEDFKDTVKRAIGNYSYIIYPTIKHTEEKPRYRLVVKPSEPMNKETYKAVVTEIAEKIGFEYDTASLTWSQLQGLPVTVGNRHEYVKTINEVNHIPMFIARNKLKEFAEDMGIDKPKLGQFSKAVISELQRNTGNEYKAKNGTTRIEFYDTLDPHGFHRDKFVPGIWGIGLIEK